MTFETKVAAFLESHGLWPDEVSKTIDATKTANPEVSNLWNDRPEDFPAPMLALLTLRARDEAIAFLEATKPNHFALHTLRAR